MITSVHAAAEHLYFTLPCDSLGDAQAVVVAELFAVRLLVGHEVQHALRAHELEVEDILAGDTLQSSCRWEPL